MLRRIRRRGAALLVSIVALALLTAGCTSIRSITAGASPYTVGSGGATTEVRTFGPFRELEATGSVRVEVRLDPAGSEHRVEVRTDENLVAMIRTEVTDGRLRVWIDGSVTTTLGVDLVVVAPALDALVANASAVVRAEGIVGPVLAVTATSAAAVSATGTVERLDLRVVAAARASLFDLAADEVSVDIAGAAKAEVRASEAVRGTVTAAGTLWIDGDPPVVDVIASAAGSVNRR